MLNYTYPDERGHYGIYGGRYIPETLMQSVLELEAAYKEAMEDEAFIAQLNHYLEKYVGRATPLYLAENLTKRLGGAKIYLKREDLNHTGAHKINNTIGQALLAVRMGKKKVVAETGAGQHGVATATVCALLGLECIIFMGEEDIQRQKLNVFRMELLGAKVQGVSSGSATLKDAVNEALRYWVTNVADTHYIMGSVLGPHPFPQIVRDFQSIIGTETIEQYLAEEGKMPEAVVACIGGGSNAMGMFYPFVPHEEVKMYGVEAAGSGVDTEKHAATLTKGRVGVLHGSMMYLLQNEDGQIQEAHSISAGLDYPGVGPEHSLLKDLGRAEYHSVTDEEALEAFQLLAREEGIIPALESSHAIAFVLKLAPTMKKEEGIVVCLSGRGDKDVESVKGYLAGGNNMGAERIEGVFQKLKAAGEKAFVPYIMAGDGGLEKLKETILFLDQEGASVLEIGIPFSDPVADGPTIQRAGKRALDNGTTLSGIFQALIEVRPHVSVPFVLMTYLNPILSFGRERFIEKCVQAGVDGLIIPDLPFEHNDVLSPVLKPANIALIPLVTLTSPIERIRKIASEASGFLYAVTVTGVTGVRREFQESLFTYLEQVKSVTTLPVLAGFGISTPEHVKEMAKICDGVVVGSRIIDLLEEGNKEGIRDLIQAARTVAAK